MGENRKNITEVTTAGTITVSFAFKFSFAWEGEIVVLRKKGVNIVAL